VAFVGGFAGALVGARTGAAMGAGKEETMVKITVMIPPHSRSTRTRKGRGRDNVRSIHNAQLCTGR
jgi:hypothetical protein